MSSVSKPKVICLGLGRTGVSATSVANSPTVQWSAHMNDCKKTTSMLQALEMLGFGPGYHMSTILQEGGKDIATWNKIGDGRLYPVCPFVICSAASRKWYEGGH